MRCILLVYLGSLAFSASAQQPDTPEPPYYPDWHARAKDYVFRTYTDPQRAAWLLVDSARDTIWKEPVNWDRSADSYYCRVASGWGRRIVRNTLQMGFETALHEDSRYRISAETAFRKRVWFAISRSVLAYRPDGTTEPAYGRISANVATAAISSTWHPASISAPTLLSGMGASALDRAGNNLLTEFQPDLIHFGRKTWKTVTRK